MKLPVWEKRPNILDALEKNQVLVISGMTGYSMLENMTYCVFCNRKALSS